MQPRPDVRARSDELTPVLDRLIARSYGGGVGATRIHQSRSPYSSSYRIDDLDVELTNGVCLHLVHKDLSPDAMLDDAKSAKPRFLQDSMREIEVYRQVLHGTDLGAPRFLGAHVDAAAGRYWLFIERVNGLPLGHIGEWEVWLSVARWLARMHVRLAEMSEKWPHRAIRYDAAFYQRWPRRALMMASPETGRRLQQVIRAYAEVVDRLSALERTPIHGELYASNLLVDGDENPPRICPLDWEMASVGPRLVDLAALTAGRWNEMQRAELAAAYRSEADPRGCIWMSDASFDRDLASCRLLIAMQWLGWSARWAPPAEQTNDWLAEATQAAVLLGV